jgi:spermidine synthase
VTKERTSKLPDLAGRGHPRSTPEDTEAIPAAASLLPRKFGLELLVFVAGAVLMGLEIAGSRVLAPHFGNSVFVWGSLISVFLIALSLGYLLGGRLADRCPSHALLNTICLLVSLFILAIGLFARGLCELLVDAGLGEQAGPLVASSLLFLLPSIGMGMVSPFAIRLATQSLGSIGKISGTLYALSTGGSIVGTLFTTFVLIPLIGVSAILKVLGLALLLAALGTFPFLKRTHAALAMLVVGLSIVGLAAFPASLSSARRSANTILDVDTPYHHISVVDDRGARSLRFDGYTESAITKTPPYPSLAEYTKYFHLAFLANPDIERTLFIGAGGGVGPREFHMQKPYMRIDVVDIDPEVLRIARRYFFLDDDPQINLFSQDGRLFLRKTTNRYDCVILDAFSAGGQIPFHLVTQEFLESCRSKLEPGGVFMMNINSAIEGPLSPIFHSMYRTIASVFPTTYVFAVHHRDIGTTESMNIIFLATQVDHRISAAEWNALAKRHHSLSYISDAQIKDMVGDLIAEPADLASAPIFVDDFAPIETMPF